MYRGPRESRAVPLRQRGIQNIKAVVEFSRSTQPEVPGDEHRVEPGPYPDSRVGVCGFVGWSPSAEQVLSSSPTATWTAIRTGLNAGPASGRDLATYHAEVIDGQQG